MFCRHCGSEIPDGSKFCENCGISILRAGPSEQSVSGTDAADAKNSQNPIPILPVNVPPTPVNVRKDGKKLALAFSGGMALFVVYLVSYLLYKLRKDTFHPIHLLLAVFMGFCVLTIVFGCRPRKLDGRLFALCLIALIVISCISPFCFLILKT